MFNNCNGYKGIHNQSILKTKDINNIRETLNEMSCEDVERHVHSIIGSPSERATIYKIILKDYVIAVKVMKHGHLRENEYDISREISSKAPNYFLRTIDRKFCQINDKNIIFNTQMLFLELAIGDLYQVLDQGIDSRTLEDYISDVFKAVEVLSNLGYKHNDLTVKNVFVVCTGKNTRAVLGLSLIHI